MAEVILAESAWEDLDAIAEYISRDSARYAAEFTTRLLDCVTQLSSFPESGRVVPEFDTPHLRELIHGNFRIVYSIEDAEVTVVLRFIHTSRQFP